MENNVKRVKYTWKRRVNPGEPYYEVSTKGDSRFSALNARLVDGRTIEEAYQLDVKGYRRFGNDWRLGKGKAPLIPQNELPKLSSKFFELRGAPMQIMEDLMQFANQCNKLIYSTIQDKTVMDFIRIVKTEHPDCVNSHKYDPDDIVLVLLDNSLKSVFENEYNQALECLVSAGSIGVSSFVTLHYPKGIKYNSSLSSLTEIIGGKYKEIGDSGYFVDLYGQYKDLWNEWILQNMDLFLELADKANGIPITDMFASSDINQARALCDLLNKYFNL